MSKTPMIQAMDVTREFTANGRTVKALQGVTLHAYAGQVLVLKGRSGAGKTTLLNILAGIDAPTSGSVTRTSAVGYVMQDFGLMDVLTAAENVELPLRIEGVPAEDRKARVSEALLSVGLSRQGHQRPEQLSGGQRQRVAIARALVTKRSIILADEPTGQLDSLSAKNVMDIFQELAHQNGVAVVLTTHDPILVERADRVLSIHDGVLGEL